MLRQRILTAVILGGMIVGGVVYLPTYILGLFLAAVVFIAAWEWATCVGLHTRLQKISYALTILLCSLGCLELLDDRGYLLIILAALVWWNVAIFLVATYQNNNHMVLLSMPLKAFIGGIILVPCWLSFLLIHSHTSGIELALFLLILIWLADTAAYFSGKRFARVKLLSKVSPGKSREGVYGALIMTFLWALAYAYYDHMQFIHAIFFIVLAQLTVCFSILGDLVESMFKRMVYIKDSGNILPGHGGVLDRIDSLTSATPIFFIGLWVMERLP